MTAATRAAIVDQVYSDEIVATGTDDAWDEYDEILASVPRHDASLDVQREFAGDLPDPDQEETWR